MACPSFIWGKEKEKKKKTEGIESAGREGSLEGDKGLWVKEGQGVYHYASGGIC